MVAEDLEIPANARGRHFLDPFRAHRLVESSRIRIAVERDSRRTKSPARCDRMIPEFPANSGTDMRRFNEEFVQR